MSCRFHGPAILFFRSSSSPTSSGPMIVPPVRSSSSTIATTRCSPLAVETQLYSITVVWPGTSVALSFSSK